MNLLTLFAGSLKVLMSNDVTEGADTEDATVAADDEVGLEADDESSSIVCVCVCVSLSLTISW